MNAHTFNINLYDLATLAVMFTGLNFAALLFFTKSINGAAKRFLAPALVVMVLWMVGILDADIRLPLQFSLALGPLIFFYVLRLTRPERKFGWKDMVHFSPVLLQLSVQLLPLRSQLNTVSLLLTFLSVVTYLHLSHRLIESFYRQLKFNGGDRYRNELQWLHRLLLIFGLSWLLWIPCAAVNYFGYHNQFSLHTFYPLYLLLGVTMVWIGATAFLRPELELPVSLSPALKSSASTELRQKGIWLKRVIEDKRLYQDPELSLSSLAGKLAIHPHELSYIINTALKKSFNDFVNEYRVKDVVRKMQDPAYDRLTLLGIAYESGFNSKRTFNRVFKEITGKTPVEHKNNLKKEAPIDKLAPSLSLRPVTLRQESPPVWASEPQKRKIMIKNYLKTAYRNLIKNKGFTAINILGLSVGLTTCLLIVFYVVDELSYDRYNVNAANIYRITLQIKFNGNEASYPAAEAPLAGAISNLLGIEKYARLLPTESLFISPRKYFVRKGNEDLLENNIVFAESNIFNVFTLPMIEGSPRDALTAPRSIVITESTAKKYFNKTDVLGQTLTLNDTSVYKITGVLKDIPAQSHFHYDFFVSLSSIPEGKLNNWGFGGFHTYLVLKPGTNVKALQTEIAGIAIREGYPPKLWSTGDNYYRIVLTPLLDIHLRSNTQYELGKGGNIQYVYIFSAIAILILLIACVNFMNLSTARSSNRAKEVGVRKVLGSARKYLIAQFLTESFMVTLLSAIVALVLVWLLLPLFNQMADRQLSFSLRSMVWLVQSSLAIVLVIGFLAGSYPAFVLSAFQPIDVLKGKIAAGFKAGFLRSFLVVFQFSISIFLIIGTLVIYSQLNYIHNKSLGFNRNQILVIKNAANLGANAKLLKQELKQFPGVVSTTMTGYLPTGGDRTATALFPYLPVDLKDDMLTQFWPVDEDYISTMGIQLVAGRNFSGEMATDSSAIIVNQAFAKRLGLKNPLGKIVYRDTYGVQPYHIIGVMKDFNFNSLHDEIGNAVLYNAENKDEVSVKINSANLSTLMAQIESEWKSLAPNQSFTYSFMDEDFDATYRAEQRVGSLFIAFSTLAILIACLGLFGLAAYAAEQRNKEIGIRKVLGASVPGIVGMLSVDFIKLVFIAILIATPAGWFAMNKWLQSFPTVSMYRGG